MKLPQFYYNSRTSAVNMLLFTLVSLAGCSWFLNKTIFHATINPTWFKWLFATVFGLLTAFFGMAAFMLAQRLFSRRPRLSLTASGIIDQYQKIGEIDWSDIKAAELYSSGISKTTVKLELYNTEKYQARLSIIGRITRINWLSNSQLTLNLSGTNAQAAEILGIIKSHITQNT